MEPPNKLLKQIVLNTRLKTEQHMLIITGISTHERSLSQPLQTFIKQFKLSVTFLTG